VPADELGLEVLVQLHDARNVATPITVVRCTPDRDHTFVVEMPFIALVDQLMSPSDQLQAIDMIELRRDLVTKQPARASGTDSPGLDFFGVAPDEVAEGAFMRDLLGAGDDADLIERPDFGGEAAVYAEDFAVYDGAEGQEVKDLAGGLPDGRIAVFVHALFVETVDLGYLARLVVAADQRYAFGVSMTVSIVVEWSQEKGVNWPGRRQGE